MGDLTVNEVAERLNLEPRWVRELLQHERLSGYKNGRKWVIPGESLNAYLTSVRSDGGIRNNLTVSSSLLLREHWDRLTPTLFELREIEPFPVHDFDLVTFNSRAEERCWPIPKGRICREMDGGLVVRLNGEEKLPWAYLKQHLLGDPIWQLVEDWKGAMAEDFSARLALLKAVIMRIEADTEGGGLNWPVLAEIGTAFASTAPDHGQSVSLYYAFRLYDQAMSRSLALRYGGYLERDFLDYHGAAGVVELGGNPVIYAPETARRTEAIEFFLRGQAEMASFPAAKIAADAYRRVERATDAVKAQVERLYHAAGCPSGSFCDGCRG